MLTLTSALILSAFIFSVGVFVILSRRSLSSVVIGAQLFLLSVNISFVAFSRFVVNEVDGHVFAMFIMAVGAGESALLLASILWVGRKTGAIEFKDVERMRG